MHNSCVCPQLTVPHWSEAIRILSSVLIARPKYFCPSELAPHHHHHHHHYGLKETISSVIKTWVQVMCKSIGWLLRRPGADEVLLFFFKF